ncbi:IS1595 family transposase [endosymbiont DhMRE of Dentiscutata heterogama]|uniref:IS1595 family transposase n=1 Tax=endosymbiont DhMRE of Dentiscutata heterogama TaxID=1609546 RepID=UPI002AD58977|nr:IS1595 family transposase [endosymbiont DhMRE of Dentiscutata heterogama]
MVEFKNLSELSEFFPTKQSCIDYFEKLRWNGNPVSPYDPTSKVYELARKNQYRCKNTGKDFNVMTGTIFENSKIPIRKWFNVTGILVSHLNGVSSYELTRDFGITHKSTWFMLHRLRHACDLPIFKTMMEGTVELDETYIGGKNKNRHKNKKIPYSQGRSQKDKVPVFGMLERSSGRVIMKVVSDAKMKTLVPIIRKHVKEGSNLNTDEWYRKSKQLDRLFNHQLVNHGDKEYVKENVSVNAIENRWSRLKSMIGLTYRRVSKKHFQNYLNEFAIRNNASKISFQEKFDLVLLSTVGKRLTYQQLIS